MKKLLLKIAYSILRRYGELPLGVEVDLGGIICFKGVRYYISDITLEILYSEDSSLRVKAKEVKFYGGD